MASGGMDWFRWHHGSVNDPKFQLVARKVGCSLAEVIAVWACVLEAASQAEERGAHGALDFEALDCALGLPDGRTSDIYLRMQDRALVDGENVMAWHKRQPKREDETANERKRRQREREHEIAISKASGVTNEASRIGVSDDVTLRVDDKCHDVSRNVTQCHARGEESRGDIGIPRAKALSSTAAPPTPPTGPAGIGPHGPVDGGLSGGDGGGAPALPPCPHRELLALYAQHLPMLAQPRPELWADSQGATDLRNRWRWVLSAKKPDGVRYAESSAQALDWFSRFFAWVAASDFLAGRSEKGFVCSLQWLVKKANFEKVLQGNFKNKS